MCWHKQMGKIVNLKTGLAPTQELKQGVWRNQIQHWMDDPNLTMAAFPQILMQTSGCFLFF